MAKHMESREYYEQTIGGLNSTFVLVREGGNADADGADQVWITFHDDHLTHSREGHQLSIGLNLMDPLIASLVEIRKLMWTYDQPDLPPGTERMSDAEEIEAMILGKHITQDEAERLKSLLDTAVRTEEDDDDLPF